MQECFVDLTNDEGLPTRQSAINNNDDEEPMAIHRSTRSQKRKKVEEKKRDEETEEREKRIANKIQNANKKINILAIDRIKFRRMSTFQNRHPVNSDGEDE